MRLEKAAVRVITGLSVSQATQPQTPIWRSLPVCCSPWKRKVSRCLISWCDRRARVWNSPIRFLSAESSPSVNTYVCAHTQKSGHSPFDFMSCHSMVSALLCVCACACQLLWFWFRMNVFMRSCLLIFVFVLMQMCVCVWFIIVCLYIYVYVNACFVFCVFVFFCTVLEGRVLACFCASLFVCVVCLFSVWLFMLVCVCCVTLNEWFLCFLGPGNCFARLRVYVFVGGFFFRFCLCDSWWVGGVGGSVWLQEAKQTFLIFHRKSTKPPLLASKLVLCVCVCVCLFKYIPQVMWCSCGAAVLWQVF